MDPITTTIVFVAILVISVVFHEVAHGVMAYRLGDPTAKYAGRLTLNPIPHIDPFFSILLPAVLVFAGSPILFGGAKPVPVNYNNLSNIRRDMFLIAIVGPLTNIALALVAGLVFRMYPSVNEIGSQILLQTVTLNLVLAFFNMIPIPPLDGSKVLGSILGYIDHNLMYRFLDLERFGFLLLIPLFLVPGLFSSILLPPVFYLMELFTGQSFIVGI